jgi:quercetin dioxygenase-like cupin family protein
VEKAMAEKEEKSHLLSECVGKGQKMIELIEYANDSIVSKTLLDKSVSTITLFAFDKGQKLSEHTSPYDAVVQILDGKAQVRIKDETHELSEGQLIIMPANIPHAVNAGERFKMLLTMIRA